MMSGRIGLQLLVGEPEALEHAGREVLRHHVRDRDQPAEQIARALRARVEGDAELLDVVVVERPAEVDAAPLVRKRWDAAQDVPPALPHRILDADHLRAERGQESRRACAGELSGEITDAEMRERPGRHAGS